MSNAITRRAAVIGALFSSFAIGIPAVAAITPKPEDAYDRMRRLSKELAQALAEVASHPTAPHSYVAFVLPATEQNRFPTGVMDLDDYLDMRSRTMTSEQAAAVADWRQRSIDADNAWADYTASFNQGAGARHEYQPLYDGWRQAHMAQQDAHIEMSRLFYRHR